MISVLANSVDSNPILTHSKQLIGPHSLVGRLSACGAGGRFDPWPSPTKYFKIGSNGFLHLGSDIKGSHYN